MLTICSHGYALLALCHTDIFTIKDTSPVAKITEVQMPLYLLEAASSLVKMLQVFYYYRRNNDGETSSGLAQQGYNAIGVDE